MYKTLCLWVFVFRDLISNEEFVNIIYITLAMLCIIYC